MSTARVVCLLVSLCSMAHGAISPADLNALVIDAVAFLEPGSSKAEDYACTYRNIRKEFDANGKVKSEQLTLAHRTFRDGFAVYEVLERNGRTLDLREQKEQEDKIRKQLAEARSMSKGDIEKRRKKSAESSGFIAELPDALQFKVVGEDVVDKRSVLVVDAEPRPGYRARNMKAKLFEKLKAKLWIDSTDRQLVKAEAETFDTVSLGLGVLGKVEKGTRFAMHRIKLPDGTWVVDSQGIRFAARIMLVKWMNQEMSSQISDFRHKSQASASR
ncbi:MAG: hypothetical protein H7039_15265 [Bryobacteraceae bacterium]|nr:hypothetical protein [Bryobacteraceae bacterium]